MPYRVLPKVRPHLASERGLEVLALLTHLPPSVLGLLVQGQVELRETAQGFVATSKLVWGFGVIGLITRSPASFELLAEPADK